MDAGQLAWAAAAILLLFGKPIWTRLQYAYVNLSRAIPSAGGWLTAEVKFPAWQGIGLVICVLGMASGTQMQGCKLPDVTLPTWPTTDTLPLSKMRVLILNETSPAKPLTDEQSQALSSLDVRDYLDKKTLADSAGGKGWRRLDPDSPVTNLPKEWQTIRGAVKPTEYPWVAVVDDAGKIVFEGPYPATDTLAFFKKYGG